jgi:hypothetical protein
VTGSRAALWLLATLLWPTTGAPEGSPSPRPQLAPLESLQVTGLLTGMATVEQRVKPRTCVRYTACVGAGDPSPAVRAYIHAAGYRAVRWCSQGPVTIPSHCRRATINVLAPVILASPVELVYETSGAVVVKCKVPVEGGSGVYWPTTAKFCSDDRP